MSAPSDRATFVEGVRRDFNPSTPESFWKCEALLRTLVVSGGVTAWINSELRALISNPYLVGDWLPNEVVLHRDEHWVLSAAVIDSPRRYVHALPFFAMYVPLRSALVSEQYQLPANYRNDVFDPAVRLEPIGSVTTEKDDVLRIESDRYAYDIKISQPTPLLRLVTNPLRPLEWLFSKNTLQAWQANDGDLAYTQLRVAAYVLGKIAHQTSVNPLRGLASHPHHAVRWAAIQNLGRLSRSEALLKIRQAINDPHPHVRRAAQKTLDRLEGKVAK